MAKRKCDICGEEYDERWMFSENLGRKKLWKCFDCYKIGQRQATLFELDTNKKRAKLMNKKKVNK